MLLKFTKMHGLGNDFAVIDGITRKVYLTKDKIAKLGDRYTGIGFDQLLMVEPPSNPDMDFRYRIFNTDGSEVEHCGNGARCFAHFVRQKSLTNKTVINVETQNRNLQLQIQEDGEVTVDMDLPSFKPADLPFSVEESAEPYTIPVNGANYEIIPVSVGNPHAVHRVDVLEDEYVEAVGAAIECHDLFPKNVNVGFLHILTPNEVNLRVYERGVGETKACGTGACAAVVAGIKQGWLENKVVVNLLGGRLTIEWQGDGSPILMTGPAAKVFDGQMYL